jgi:VWFA-related protein
VYSILFDALDDFGVPRWIRGDAPDGKKVLEQISRETGARYFEVNKKWPLEKVYAAIEEDLRNQYSLGYTPERAESKEYRRIRLTTRQRGLLVQTREGYYPT